MNHVGIMLNGDNQTHHIYEVMSSLEDNLWHDVVVTIQGTNVSVTMDGAALISGEVPDLNFKGGFIGFQERLALVPTTIGSTTFIFSRCVSSIDFS